MTQFRDVVGYEGVYRVSEHGEVVSVKRNKPISQYITYKGYLRVCLCRDSTERQVYVHRIVAMAFVDGFAEGLDVNHIDCNKRNNHFTNLEWVTSQQNTDHGIANGIVKASSPVVAMPINGVVGFFYKSIRNAEKDGFDSGGICRCLSGIQSHHYGYKWEKIQQEGKV